MTDKHATQADGGDRRKGAPDGVSDPAGQGESVGGAYPHPGETGEGFDGGQSRKEYEGPDNPNATTRSDDA